MAAPPHLYRATAMRIAAGIAEGVFPLGSRLPSVRSLAQRWELSITTVLAAYRDLERDGLIGARPQTGFFVTALPSSRDPLPAPTRLEPTVVTTGDLIVRTLRAASDASLVPLGAAIPNPECLPLRDLDRAIARQLRAHDDWHAYDFQLGRSELRRPLARRLIDLGCTIAADELIITCGAQEALSLALRAVCEPGDCIAVESPLWYGALQVAQSLNLCVVEIPSHCRDGLDLGALRLVLDQHTPRAVLCCANLSNPGGGTIPQESRRELVEMLAERDIPLIDDDTYGDLLEPLARPSALRAFDTAGRVIHCGSFSKTMAPGLRLGFLAPGRYLKAVTLLKIGSNIATATLPQLACADLLTSGAYDRHLRKVRRIYADTTTQVAAAVRAHFPAGTRVARPSAGYLLWVELPVDVDALELGTEALRAGISIAPGPLFSARGGFRHHIRLCAATWNDRIAAGVAQLGRLVQHRHRRPA